MGCRVACEIVNVCYKARHRGKAGSTFKSGSPSSLVVVVDFERLHSH